MGIFIVAFGESFALKAAELLLANGERRTFYSQAHVIAWAGWEYGYGKGKDYILYL